MSRPASSRVSIPVCHLRAILLVLCCLALALSAGPAGAIAHPELEDAADDDRVRTQFSTETELETEAEFGAPSNGTIELVVRLEEADVPPSVTDSEANVQAGAADEVEPEPEVEAILEEQAEDTQVELVDYAETTPGVTVQHRFWLTNAVLVEIDVDRVDPASLERFDDVVDVHRNFELQVPEPPDASVADGEPTHDYEPPSDAHYRTAPAPARLNAPDVWRAYGTRGAGVRVAVLDTGIDVSHPDLELATDDPSDPTYPGGWASFAPDGTRELESTPHDSGRHGTAVGSLLAGGNATGRYLGVAPDVDLMAGQVLSEEGGTFAQLIAGMEWALENDADIVSMSLGSAGTDDRLIEPVRHARQHGVVVVAAVGNDGENVAASPANVYDALAVGATDSEWQVPPFSGGSVLETDAAWTDPPEEWPASYVVPDVVAPGVAVESAVPGGEYRNLSETSMATPYVSGVLALVQSTSVDHSPPTLEGALLETTWYPDGVDPGPGTRYGRGIVDAKAAVDVEGDGPSATRVTSITTDADGSYALTVTPGATTVSVEAPDYRANETALSAVAGSRVTHNVSLQRVSLQRADDDEIEAAAHESPADESSPGLGASGAVSALGVVLAVLFVRRLERR
ncbi:S8 family serine peptidase [Halomontanus rarus]|uniref:S8 family serine peptidase n=1 Tax=Halomontanus rarus TaxID=3034020 RepID=UPI0023E7DDB5|nr:S8 family serine peptidase [Halovivax sp. TS33]